MAGRNRVGAKPNGNMASARDFIGNVWFREVLTGTLIEGDVTGDFVADLSILVCGVSGMTQSDVLL